MIIKLTYSHDVTDKPILADAVLRTGLSINILEARVNTQKGELIVSIPASGEKLEDALKIFREARVQAQKYTRVLQIDYEKCISCGACISPCPTKVFRFGLDWKLEFDENKCIACRTCVAACPVKAITVP